MVTDSRLKVDSDDLEEFVREYLTRWGYSPSVRDLASQFEVSTSTMHRHLMSLVQEGRLRVDQGRSRTWRLA